MLNRAWMIKTRLSAVVEQNLATHLPISAPWTLLMADPCLVQAEQGWDRAAIGSLMPRNLEETTEPKLVINYLIDGPRPGLFRLFR